MTVSGFSCGADFAILIHIIFSDIIKGIGMVGLGSITLAGPQAFFYKCYRKDNITESESKNPYGTKKLSKKKLIDDF